MNGLDIVEIRPRSLGDKLLGRRKEEVARLHVQNVVASQPIFQVYHDGIFAILRGYGLTAEDCKPWLTELYVTVLKHFVKDGQLTYKDEQAVERLGELFGFSLEYMAQVNAPYVTKKASAETGA